jgi:tetratricopeptide (TPR) repeat protein
VPLTDPELDLLLEMLEEDPAEGVFVQVGEELIRRGRWSEAVEVLWRGVNHTPDRKAWELLARAGLESGRYEVAQAALVEVDRTPASNPEMARVEILVLERSGRLDAAKARAELFLAHDGNDVVVGAVLERLQAPPPRATWRAADPFFTVARAEHYVDIGRADRALRVYRRILLANPGSRPIELRMRQLMSAPANIADDLSAELTDPNLVPELPDASPGPIDMPSPRLSVPGDPDTLDTDVPAPVRGFTPAPAPRRGEVAGDEENTEQVDVYAALKRYAEGGSDDDSDDSEADYVRLREAQEATDPGRRKRRTLLRRE